MRKVLHNIKEIHPDSRVTAVFEFKSATSVRNVLFSAYSESFSAADAVVLWQRASNTKIPADQRMDIPALAQSIGTHASAFTDQNNMRRHVLAQLRTGSHAGSEDKEDVLLLMSCADYGDFVTEVKQLAHIR